MPSSQGPRHGTREKLSNAPRDRGISPPQRAVQTFEPGDVVHLHLDPSVPEGRFHPRFDGLTGEVARRQGQSYVVRITDNGKAKTVVVRPAHLRPQR